MYAPVRKLTVAKLVQRIDMMQNKTKQTVETTAENRANAIIKLFKKKLKSGDFIPGLKRATIKAKARKGMTQPQTPLYGWGETEKNSMYNGLKPRRLGWGKWEVKPNGKHIDGKTKKMMPMQMLFAIHETGATLKNGGRIPARKPIQRTVQDFLKSSEYKKYIKAQAKEFAKGK
jgi:hypothetical protein